MTENKKQIHIMLLKFLHLGVTLTLFYVAWILFRYGKLVGMDKYGYRYNYYVLGLYGAALLFFSRTYNAFLLGYLRIRALAFAQFLSQLFSFFTTWFLVSLAWNHWRFSFGFIVMLALQAILDVIWSYYANGYYFKLNPPRKTLLIYRNDLDKKRFGSIHGKPSERLYQITEEFQYDGYSFQAIKNKLEGFDAIFVAGVHSRCRNGIAKYCKENNIPGFFLPHVGDVIMQEAKHIQSFDSPVLFVSRTKPNPEYLLTKRVFDIVASFCGIVVLSPILLITALAIRLYDGGPAIYKQVRLTKDGKQFKIWKFRSMRVDAEKDGVARLSTGENDDRITPIGKIVRKCRLDELPQLFNILNGDMSVVGPRPERPEIAEQYYQFLPDFKLRLQVKAGLTGYAQVYGKYNTDPYEKLEFDLLYINHMSVFTDLQLIFATFGILFSRESTEGVEAGQTTAVGSYYKKETLTKATGIDYDNEAFRAGTAKEAEKAAKAVVDDEVTEAAKAREAAEIARQWED